MAKLEKVYAGRYAYELNGGVFDIYKASGHWCCDLYVDGRLMSIRTCKTLAEIKERIEKQTI